jgi:hypothetical protein
VVVGLGKQIAFVASLLNRLCAQRFLDTLAAIEVCELARHTSVISPDPAALFDGEVVFDALLDANHSVLLFHARRNERNRK